MQKVICKTKIVATVGPASDHYEVLKAMVSSGMDVMRLNFSHGTHEEHAKRIEMLRAINQELGTDVAIMLDTKGPEIRTHNFENGEAIVEKGDVVKISMRPILGTASHFSVTHAKLIDDISVGEHLLVDDGNLVLRVIDKDYENQDLICLAYNKARLINRRGINVPSVNLSLPFLSEQDKKDIAFGCQMEVDYIAASFVSKADDVLAIRAFLNENHGEHIRIIAKIESMMGVKNIDEILNVADAIMVARGDLGVEVPITEVPIFQRTIIEKCHYANKPVIVATQMLESMQTNIRPTRAEVNDVATAVLAGSDAIMLSGESAQGKYPIESVKMMNEIALRIEQDINYRELAIRARSARVTDVASTIALSVADAALQLPVVAIVAPTRTGFTASAISHFRPRVPILAVTMDRRVMRSLALRWGVYPIYADIEADSDEVTTKAVQIVNKVMHFEPGDLVIVTAGLPIKVARQTNMMKIEVIS